MEEMKIIADSSAPNITTDVNTIMEFVKSANMPVGPLLARVYAMQLEEAMKFAMCDVDSLILRNEVSREELSVPISSFVVAIGRLLQEI